MIDVDLIPVTGQPCASCSKTADFDWIMFRVSLGSMDNQIWLCGRCGTHVGLLLVGKMESKEEDPA